MASEVSQWDLQNRGLLWQSEWKEMKTKSWLHWKTSVVTSFCKLKVNSCQFHNLLPNTGGNLMFWKWCHLTEGLFFFLPQFSKTQNSLTVVSQWTCLCSYFFPLDNVKSKWWGVNFHSHNSPQKLRFVDNVNLLYFYIKRVLALMSLILAITDNLILQNQVGSATPCFKFNLLG